jgi:hypothetical protein
MKMIFTFALLGVALMVCGACRRAHPAAMTFFVTSVGLGKGGDIGGLAAADSHCAELARAAGASSRIWRAYLSKPSDESGDVVHAKDRIGEGPWVNVNGVQIAANLAELHSVNQLKRSTSLTEKAQPVPHDILTGSNEDGTLASGDSTCRGWRSQAGHAVLGHSDKQGLGTRPTSWNSAHFSDGCDLKSLSATGGAGFFYCFALQ